LIANGAAQVHLGDRSVVAAAVGLEPGGGAGYVEDRRDRQDTSGQTDPIATSGHQDRDDDQGSQLRSTPFTGRSGPDQTTPSR
jgi:hypothetical protein